MRRPLVALALLPLLVAADRPADRAAPYRLLQQANVALDPALAASTYAADATLSFDYPGGKVETFRGRDAIRGSYVRTFGQVDPGTPVMVAFRFEAPGLAADHQVGVYRIDAQAGGRPITVYGRFAARLVREQGQWRFAEDRGGPAVAADYERLPATEFGRQ